MSIKITDELVIEIIDKGFSALGDSPKQAIWYCLEKDFKLERQKVPEKLEAFEETLKRFFGLGYSFLEGLFRQNLQEATGEDLQCYKSFAGCVRGLRKKAENVEGYVICPEFLEQTKR